MLAGRGHISPSQSLPSPLFMEGLFGYLLTLGSRWQFSDGQSTSEPCLGEDGLEVSDGSRETLVTLVGLVDPVFKKVGLVDPVFKKNDGKIGQPSAFGQPEPKIKVFAQLSLAVLAHIQNSLAAHHDSRMAQG